MEVRVYLSMSAFTHDKRVFCQRVQNRDCFSFEDCECVLRSLYGRECVIVFLCVDCHE